MQRVIKGYYRCIKYKKAIIVSASNKCSHNYVITHVFFRQSIIGLIGSFILFFPLLYLKVIVYTNQTKVPDYIYLNRGVFGRQSTPTNVVFFINSLFLEDVYLSLIF